MSAATMTRTRTLTLSAAPTYTVSLRAPRANLDTLPVEITLHILSYALAAPGPKHDVHALALVSKTLGAAHTALLYRSIVLRSHRSLALLARTASLNPRLLSHVRAFALALDGPACGALLGAALRACSELHTLVLPGAALPGLRVPRGALHAPYPAPKHLTLSEWAPPHAWAAEPAPLPMPTELLAEVTHLAVAGPPAAVWARPREVLDALGPLRRLTHVCFARRTGGNEANDAEFVEDLRAMRQRAPVVAASLYAPVLAGTAPPDTKDLREALEEAKIGVREGDCGEWRAPWLALEVGQHAVGLEERYWA